MLTFAAGFMSAMAMMFGVILTLVVVGWFAFRFYRELFE